MRHRSPALEGVQLRRSEFVESASKAKNAAALEFCQFGIIRRPVIHRSVIELVIAGVDDQSSRSIDAQTDRIRNGMTYVEEVHRKRPDLVGLPAWTVSSLVFWAIPPRASLTSSMPRVSGAA